MRLFDSLREERITFVGKTDMQCNGGSEPCHHPAPYEVRDSRHRIAGRLCIKHLSEYRQLAVGYGPSLRRDRQAAS